MSYLLRKGKISALNSLKANDFPGLFPVLGEDNVTHA